MTRQQASRSLSKAIQDPCRCNMILHYDDCHSFVSKLSAVYLSLFLLDYGFILSSNKWLIDKFTISFNNISLRCVWYLLSFVCFIRLVCANISRWLVNFVCLMSLGVICQRELPVLININHSSKGNNLYVPGEKVSSLTMWLVFFFFRFPAWNWRPVQ